MMKSLSSAGSLATTSAGNLGVGLQELRVLVGAAETEVEVPPGDAQRIDLWHVPIPRSFLYSGAALMGDAVEPAVEVVMRRNSLFRAGSLLGAALLSLLLGCSEETPPFEDLLLRDALSARPEALASMPDQTRLDLALRFVDESEEQAVVDLDATGDVEDLVAQADRAREEEGKDAIVLAAIERGADGASLRALPKQAEEHFDPIAVQGDPEAATAPLEEAALRGRAGSILAHMRANSDAEEIVRVTGWPAGAIVSERVIYVNAAWLVAMSALEPPATAPAAPRTERPKSSISPTSAGDDRTGSLVINRNNTGPDYDHDSCGGMCLDGCNDTCYTDDGDCICQLRTAPRRLPWGGFALLLSPLLYASYKARRLHRP